ncbi:uncharacterized protein BCR38DRAFT_424825 [Pseudomassariella vexata]|uniref:MYND-type domain-containing protein n=1 Tax=Pseudomassariella vexata TaxID=1141098 RepID=A0A1Y2EBK6_9PEZI|nr:uncharacterized protein BCR38DRAFT_424825 [Pseudomassariella vexata]ORY68941.1 hypothetical protein BCR38DRAFT_424825 [Pseudomassariella vexata]
MPLQPITNRAYFPSFADLPGEHQYDARYYIDSTDPSLPPGSATYKKHWILLGDIIEANTFLRPRLVARDRRGHMFVVALYLDEPEDMTRLVPHFKVGNTVALMHPLAHSFLDGSHGVRIEDGDEITIFPCKVDELIKLNTDSIKHNWLVEEPKTCHSCGEAKQTMERCGGCKLAYYCSKDCQVKGWKDKGHKTQCKVLKDPDVKYLFQLDFRNYGKGFGFGPKSWKGRTLSPEELQELER